MIEEEHSAAWNRKIRRAILKKNEKKKFKKEIRKKEQDEINELNQKILEMAPPPGVRIYIIILIDFCCFSRLVINAFRLINFIIV
jgi:hypothetical protein